MDSSTIENPFPYEGRILLITNLPYDVSPTQVRDFLLCKGHLLRVDLEKDHAGQMSGMGFVEFNNASDCQSALDLNGAQFGGRTFKCKIAERPPPELTRFYIRQPEDRPVAEKVRQKIINQWKYGISDTPQQPRPHIRREHKIKPRRYQRPPPEQVETDEREPEYSDYSDSYYYSYGSYSD